MLSLGEDLNIDVGENVSLEDLLNNPEKHHWKLDFYFPEDKSRNPRGTPTGKMYGSGMSFGEIYNELSKKFGDFISLYFSQMFFDSDVKAEGDALLYSINDELGIEVETMISAEDEVYDMDKRYNVNTNRYENALERYNEACDDYYSYVEYLERKEESLPRNKSGSYDRRTRAYKDYTEAQERKYAMSEELDRLGKRVDIEYNRMSNSRERTENAIENLRGIKNGIPSRFRHKYEQSATDFAKKVKEDIISKAETGSLPLQNLPLSENTIRKRLQVGLESFPRFWATEQLISAIVVTCTLV